MQNFIDSPNNPKIKLLKKLTNKKFRKQLDKFMIENLIIIEDAVKAGFKFEEIFVTQDFINKNKERFEKLIKNNQYCLITSKVNKAFSDLETPSGIAAVYHKPLHKVDLNSKVVYLNNISDPGNLGTILRSALAFDLKNIIIDEQCADLYNFKTINAARDAIFKLKIEFDHGRELLNKIKSPIIAADLKGKTNLKPLQQDKFCLVLGNEVKGVDQDIINKADHLIKIEISDKIESLNVASAGAILFYEIFK